MAYTGQTTKIIAHRNKIPFLVQVSLYTGSLEMYILKVAS